MSQPSTAEELYREAINKIDGYFEYRSVSEKDKLFVRNVLNELTNGLMDVYLTKQTNTKRN